MDKLDQKLEELEQWVKEETGKKLNIIITNRYIRNLYIKMLEKTKEIIEAKKELDQEQNK